MIDLSERQERVNHANKLIAAIAAHGLCFFKTNDRVAYFYLSNAGRVFFHDECSGKDIYTHKKGRWNEFSHGGTLKTLCEKIRGYIVTGQQIPLDYICIQRSFDDTNVWGYSDSEAKQLRIKASQLKIISKM